MVFTGLGSEGTSEPIRTQPLFWRGSLAYRMLSGDCFLWVQNARYREEVLELSGRNLQLSGENAELSSRLRGDEGAVRLLRERLEKVTKEQQEESAKVSFEPLLLIGLIPSCDGLCGR